MKSKVKAIGTSVLLVLSLITISGLLYAQHVEHLRVGKKGDIHLIAQTKLGDTVLKAGTYKVQHTIEGQDHVVVFKGTDGKEVARLKCKLEPLNKKAAYTAVTISTNAAGEKEITQIQVSGEDAKHIF